MSATRSGWPPVPRACGLLPSGLVLHGTAALRAGMLRSEAARRAASIIAFTQLILQTLALIGTTSRPLSSSQNNGFSINLQPLKGEVESGTLTCQSGQECIR